MGRYFQRPLDPGDERALMRRVGPGHCVTIAAELSR